MAISWQQSLIALLLIADLLLHQPVDGKAMTAVPRWEQPEHDAELLLLALGLACRQGRRFIFDMGEAHSAVDRVPSCTSGPWARPSP